MAPMTMITGDNSYTNREILSNATICSRAIFLNSNTILRKEKDDKLKATNSPETYIVADQITASNSKDHKHIKSSGIPGQCLLVNDNWRTENSTMKTISAVLGTQSDFLIPSTILFDSVDLTSDDRIAVFHQYIGRYPLPPGRILNNTDDLTNLYFR